MIGLVEQNRKTTVEKLYKVAFDFFKMFNPREQTITFKEVHLNPSLRADILNISWSDAVSIIELKSCRKDYDTDHKWNKYMDFCDYFWFMCPWGDIKVEELPKEVGLIWVKLDKENPYFSIVKKPKKLKPRNLNNEWLRKTYKKLAFRKNLKVGDKAIDLDEITFFHENL